MAQSLEAARESNKIPMVSSTTHDIADRPLPSLHAQEVDDLRHLRGGGNFLGHRPSHGAWRLLHFLLSGCSSSIPVTLTLTGASAPSRRLFSFRLLVCPGLAVSAWHRPTAAAASSTIEWLCPRLQQSAGLLASARSGANLLQLRVQREPPGVAYPEEAYRN